MKIAVIGDGGWGTTLAILLERKGFSVTLWGAFADYVAHLRKKRINERFLPGVKIPEGIEITHDLGAAIALSQLVVLAVPSQYFRKVLRGIKRKNPRSDGVYLSVTKGIEVGSLKRMSQIAHEELGKIKLAVLSGPTIAREVASGIPTAAVIASSDAGLRRYLQGIFMTDRFRIYTNDDIIGVELGGSLKNIIAIACGISDGLGFGTNTKAALLSRGLAEIARLGHAMGANVRTFSGISGLGDLVTTCISPYSRNRFVGFQIGEGKSLKQVQKHMQMPACRQAGVAEGVPTVKSAVALSLKHKVDMPITKQVYLALYKNKPPLKCLKELMARERKEE